MLLKIMNAILLIILIYSTLLLFAMGVRGFKETQIIPVGVTPSHSIKLGPVTNLEKEIQTESFLRQGITRNLSFRLDDGLHHYESTNINLSGSITISGENTGFIYHEKFDDYNLVTIGETFYKLRNKYIKKNDSFINFKFENLTLKCTVCSENEIERLNNSEIYLSLGRQIHSFFIF